MEKKYSTLGDVPSNEKMSALDQFLVFLAYGVVISLMMIISAKGIIGG